MNEAFLPSFGLDAQLALENRLHLINALSKNDFDSLHTYLSALYDSLPHDWYRNNPIANYEGHYASVLYSHFAAFGLDVTVEDASNQGKVDMTINFNKII